MPAEECGPRLQELGAQLRELRARDAELESATTAEQQEPEATDELLAKVCARIERVMDTGSPAEKKALVRDLVHEITIDGNRAYPRYLVPRTGVRKLGTLVDPGLQNTNPAATIQAGAIDLTEPGRRTGQQPGATSLIAGPSGSGSTPTKHSPASSATPDPTRTSA